MGAHVVAIARRWIGTRYRHQASLFGVGCDCLGLFRGIWREIFGREPGDIPPYTPDWNVSRGRYLKEAASALLLPVEASERVAGDVLLFRIGSSPSPQHLGIYASDAGKGPSFIHAYSQHGVVESALSSSWARRLDTVFRIPARRI